MSQYSFIAANYNLQEVDNTNSKIITVSEAIELGIKEDELKGRLFWDNIYDKILI